MAKYKLEFDSDRNLGIYYRTSATGSEVWLGNILEPDSPNPTLVLGIPLGILGVRKVLDVFEKWKAGPHDTTGTKQPSRRLVRCRLGTRKWRKAFHAGR